MLNCRFLMYKEMSRAKAKHALDKYMFYFERFMNHDKAMKFAVKERLDVERKVQRPHDKHALEIIELQLLYDALKQVTPWRWRCGVLSSRSPVTTTHCTGACKTPALGQGEGLLTTKGALARRGARALRGISGQERGVQA